MILLVLGERLLLYLSLACSKHPLLLEGMHSDHEHFPIICAIVGGYLLHVLKAAIDFMHNDVTKLDAREEC